MEIVNVSTQKIFKLCLYVVFYCTSYYVIGFVEMAPEIQIAVPSLGENNVHNFVVLTFERTEVTLLYMYVDDLY